MINKKDKIINVPHSAKKQIMIRLNTTYPTVRKALNGYVGNELARKIRHLALTQFGGAEVEPRK